MVVNEAKVFVDYGAYPKEEYANKFPVIPVMIDEKQYVFTVYDEASNGLCCSLGEGYYKILPSRVLKKLLLHPPQVGGRNGRLSESRCGCYLPGKECGCNDGHFE